MATTITAHRQLPGANHRLIEPQKVGTEFLASSHFQIAQDEPTVTQNTHKSIFKKDYVPWEVFTKPAASTPPRPADVLQKDDRYFNEKASETKQAYEYRHLAKPELKGISSKLRDTNFKMDTDPRFNGFQTTHNLDYPPKYGGNVRGQPKGNPMQSFIPQGDPDKAPEPVSDYRDRYRGHDVLSAKPEKAQGAHGRTTITGDCRQHQFNTTHNDTYKGVSLPRVVPYPAPVGSNIPQGDVDKETAKQTTHQTSYPAYDSEHLRAYDQGAVTGKLRVTNFKQDDGLGAWNDYISTMTASYKPVSGDRFRMSPDKHRNHSDFPPGDDNVYRNADRSNMTTNRFYHGDPPATRKPRIESGADRTKSQVVFGEPSLDNQFYETTTDTTFKPWEVKGKPERVRMNAVGGVPMDYYNNDKNNTTYTQDYLDPETGKMIPNPEAIDRLKASHIHAPAGGLRWFSTEHIEQFTPKKSTRVAVDPGRLQKSSVPIGTLRPGEN